MYGDRGWYLYTPQPYAAGALELYCLSRKAEDRSRVPASRWLSYLEGKDPGYPEEALRRDLARVRERVAGMRRDTTTPDTRLADDPLKFNPASVTALVELMVGGVPPGLHSGTLHCRLRYFDPVRRRAGIPEGVAALIDGMTADSVTVTLVNVNQVEARTVVVQAGAYAGRLRGASDHRRGTGRQDGARGRLAPGGPAGAGLRGSAGAANAAPREPADPDVPLGPLKPAVGSRSADRGAPPLAPGVAGQAEGAQSEQRQAARLGGLGRRRQQEGVPVTDGAGPVTNDLAAVVNAHRLLQNPAGVGRDQAVQVRHLAIDQQEGMAFAVRGTGSANDVARVVNAIGRASGAAECAQVGHLPVAVDEGVRQ
jgi:hypothetical protein